LNPSEACGAQVVGEVPIGEEPNAFAVTERAPAIGGFDFARLFDPGDAKDGINVTESLDVRDAEAGDAGRFGSMSASQQGRKPSLSSTERVLNVTDDQTAGAQRAVDLTQTPLHIVVVWEKKEDVQGKDCVEV